MTQNSLNKLDGEVTNDKIGAFWANWQETGEIRQKEISAQVAHLMQVRNGKGVQFGRTGNTRPNAGR